MKDFETISELEILNYAWFAIIKKYEREEERANSLHALGKEAPIAEARMKKLSAQGNELHDRICELENALSSKK